jgi:hypothetical protein
MVGVIGRLSVRQIHFSPTRSIRWYSTSLGFMLKKLWLMGPKTSWTRMILATPFYGSSLTSPERKTS